MNTKSIFVMMLVLALLVTPASASPIDDFMNWAKASIPRLAIGSDMTINSISATQVISNSADLQTANFLVTATVNTGGQSVIGTFDGADFKQYSGYQTTYPLQISMGNIKEVLTYPIVNQGQILKFTTLWSSEMSQTEVITKCATSTADYCYRTLVREEWGGLYRYYKALEVRTSSIGSNGMLNNPTITWSGDMTVSVNGLSQTKSIGSGQTGTILTLPAVDFYSGSTFIANAAWQGGLLTGEATPYPGLYRATYTDTAARWKVSPIQYWSNYEQSLTSSKTTQTGWKTTGNIDCANNGAWDAQCTDVFNIVNAHNSIVDTLLQQDTRVTSVTGTGESLSASTTGTASSGVVTETTARRIMNPQLTMRVAAKHLGVLIPVGTPKIVGVSTPNFPSGSQGSVTLTVQNTGTASGTFSATFTDPSGTYSPGVPQNTIINAGQTGTITIPILMGTVAADTTKTVTYRVFEVNMPSNYDEEQGTITTTTPLSCTPGVNRIVGTNVYRCNDDGRGETLVVSCPTGTLVYHPETLSYTCDTGSDPGTGIIKITAYKPTGEILTNAPIYIDGVLEPDLGMVEKNVPTGSHTISTNNITNPEWYAPEPKTVTVTKTTPTTVNLVFSILDPKKGDAETLLIIVVIIGIVVIILFQQGLGQAIVKNPWILVVVLMLAVFVWFMWTTLSILQGIIAALQNSPLGVVYNLINWVFHLGGLIK